MEMLEVPTTPMLLGARPGDLREAAGNALSSTLGSTLGKETYASFLLLAIAIFTLAGYLGLALLFVGAVR